MNASISRRVWQVPYVAPALVGEVVPYYWCVVGRGGYLSILKVESSSIIHHSALSCQDVVQFCFSHRWYFCCPGPCCSVCWTCWENYLHGCKCSCEKRMVSFSARGVSEEFCWCLQGLIHSSRAQMLYGCCCLPSKSAISIELHRGSRSKISIWWYFIFRGLGMPYWRGEQTFWLCISTRRKSFIWAASSSL